MSENTNESAKKEAEAPKEPKGLKKPIYPVDKDGRRIMSPEEVDFFGVCGEG